MEWAKVEVEFPPDLHDPSEVVEFLTEHFRHESGVPTATITLVNGGEPDDEADAGIATMGADGIAWANGRPPASLKAGALVIAGIYPREKIVAIKEMRTAYKIGLKEAKDFMDAAYASLGL